MRVIRRKTYSLVMVDSGTYRNVSWEVEVGIVAFPDVDRVASLGIGPEIVVLPAADTTAPGEQPR